jgi:hypothetical protein
LDLLRCEVLINHFLLSWEPVVFDLLLTSFNFKLLITFFLFYFVYSILNLVLQAVLLVLIFTTHDQATLSQDFLQLLLRHFEFIRVLFVLLLQVLNQHFALFFIQLINIQQHVFFIGLFFFLLVEVGCLLVGASVWSCVMLFLTTPALLAFLIAHVLVRVDLLLLDFFIFFFLAIFIVALVVVLHHLLDLSQLFRVQINSHLLSDL